MVSVQDRARRVEESKQKILPPFKLDTNLCLYSPQDNVDSLKNKRVKHWLEFVTQRFQPSLPKGKTRILLLMPCTKTKPYPFSLEHKHINQRLLDEGFQPTSKQVLPPEIVDRLEDDFDPEVLSLAPLQNREGVVLHRVVISEPLAFVPYEHIVEYEGGTPSPSAAYDDPGLFENRGNAISPWREDCTATQISATRWRWGPSEIKAYVKMHNVMSAKLAEAIQQTATAYDRRIAWVAPGLTHRSFVLGKDERSAHGVPKSKRAGKETLELTGANDHLPLELQITCVPTVEQCAKAVDRLAKRLKKPKSAVSAIYARGGGGATPLALPELLDDLIKEISASSVSRKKK